MLNIYRGEKKALKTNQTKIIKKRVRYGKIAMALTDGGSTLQKYLSLLSKLKPSNPLFQSLLQKEERSVININQKVMSYFTYATLDKNIATISPIIPCAKSKKRYRKEIEHKDTKLMSIKFLHVKRK